MLVYKFIKNYISEHGYSPSFREIRTAVGLSSASTVRVHLTHLAEDGLIAFQEGVPRTIRIVSATSARTNLDVLADMVKEAKDSVDGTLVLAEKLSEMQKWEEWGTRQWYEYLQRPAP